MIPDGNGKPESRDIDPDQMMKMLEIELAQKRTAWAQTSERYRRLRTASFFFLALVLMGALVAFFFLYTRLSGEHPAATSPAPSATPAR